MTATTRLLLPLALLVICFVVFGCMQVQHTEKDLRYDKDMYSLRLRNTEKVRYQPRRRVPVKNNDEESTQATLEKSELPRETAISRIWKPFKNNQAWVLVVGVGQYQAEYVPSLPFAEKDAQTVRDWFIYQAK